MTAATSSTSPNARSGPAIANEGSPVVNPSGTSTRGSNVFGGRITVASSVLPESFSLDGDPATVTLEASYSKRRRRDTLPLPSSLAVRLRGWLASKPQGKPVFALPDKPHQMSYRDLARAKIPQVTSAGILDLHSLRHSFVPEIVAGGASVKTAQELARHSTPKLTIDV